MATIINTRADLDAAPQPIRENFLKGLAASIYRYDAEGEVLTDESTVERFGFSKEDFPDAPIAEYVAPVEEEVVEE